MIELDRHIEILLLKSDCVIVPDLGGFVASHVAARYDEGDNMFIPPLRTLGFNQKLTLNDSLLAQSYSEAYDISYPDACERIANEVNELKQHIANSGAYELNNIGTLYLNTNGNIEFAPCEAGILTPDLYSLSSFEMRKSVGLYSEEPERKSKSIANSESSNINKTFTIEPKDSENKHINENDKRIQIRISAIRNLVAAVIAVILFMVLGTPVNESRNMVKTSNIDNGIISNLINNGYDNISKKEDIQLKSKKLQKKKDNVKNEPVATQKEMKEEKAQSYFCIVLASHVTPSNAEEFVTKLVKNGYDDSEVLKEKGRALKVVYGHYKSNNEAYNALNNLRGKEYFYDAWIYQVKH